MRTGQKKISGRRKNYIITIQFIIFLVGDVVSGAKLNFFQIWWNTGEIQSEKLLFLFLGGRGTKIFPASFFDVPRGKKSTQNENILGFHFVSFDLRDKIRKFDNIFHHGKLKTFFCLAGLKALQILRKDGCCSSCKKCRKKMLNSRQLMRKKKCSNHFAAAFLKPKQ